MNTIALTETPSIPGSIPEEIGYLSNLRALLLKGNGIGGSIPSGIGLLSRLVSIDLSGNVIEGTIPKEMANLKKVESIMLNDNKLSGDVPTKFGELDLLTLTIQNNEIAGNISFLCDNDFEDVGRGGGLKADCKIKVACSCCSECF